uniref:Uncharacterized protein n=1 Tax=Plectus sambesii TaxID=2011161 RepID=A0A914XIR1_9BILA
MLSDFQDFAVEEDVEEVDRVAPKVYEPVVENKAWFLSTEGGDSRDVLRMRAAYFYRQKQFAAAFDEYLRLLEGDHKPSYRFELLETAIRCGLRSNQSDRCLALLDELVDFVKSPDQQFQFWHVARELYKSTRNVDDWRRTLMLLLNDNEHNPHYWLELAETDDVIGAGNSNMRVGCTLRALELLKRTAATDCGFGKEANERLIASLRETVLSFPQDHVTSALVNVCSDMVTSEQLPHAFDAGEFSYRGDSESKVDSGRLLTDAEQQIVVENFRERFSWLFRELNPR